MSLEFKESMERSYLSFHPELEKEIRAIAPSDTHFQIGRNCIEEAYSCGKMMGLDKLENIYSGREENWVNEMRIEADLLQIKLQLNIFLDDNPPTLETVRFKNFITQLLQKVYNEGILFVLENIIIL